MQVEPVVGTLPTGGLSVEGLKVRSAVSGADPFFALIQSLFQNRSQGPKPADFPGSDPSPVSKVGEAAARVQKDAARDEGGRTAPSAPQRSGRKAAALKARGAAKSTAATVEETDEDPKAPEASTEALPVEVRKSLEEVQAKLKKLLERIADGLGPRQAFDELLKALALLQQLTADLAPHHLFELFKTLGPEFEKAVGEVQALYADFEEVRTESAPIQTTAGTEGAHRAQKIHKVESLVQSLTEILASAIEGTLRPLRPVASTVGEAVLQESGVASSAEAKSRPAERAAEAQALVAEAPVDQTQPAAALRPQVKGERAVEASPADSRPEAAEHRVSAPSIAPRAVPVAAPEVASAAPSEDVPRAIGDGGGKPSPLAANLARSPLSLRPDQVATFERMARMALVSRWEGGGRLQVRLAPPQLGNLRIDLSVRDGVLNGNLRVETAAARAAVAQQVEHLKASLAEQGISVGSFQVSVDGRGQEAQDAREEKPGTRPGGEGAAGRAAEASADGASAEGEKMTYMDLKA